MVVPGPSPVNEIADEEGNRSKRGIGGWLLLLCMLLLIGQPVSLAFGMSAALAALPVRGVSLALVVVARLLVAAVGVAAGLALVGCRPGAVPLAQWSVGLSAAMDTFVYATPFYPNNRMPGVTPFVITASLAYYGIWLAYLFRSRRVRRTFGQ